MENFVLTANAVLPLFLIMALGYGIRRTPLMDDHTHQMMNKLSSVAFHFSPRRSA